MAIKTNRLRTGSLVADEILTHTLTVTGPTTTSAGIGAGVTAANVGVAEGAGLVHQTRLVLSATPITLSDTDAPAQGGGVKLYDFPEGRILVLGSTGKLAFTTTSAIASTLNAEKSCVWSLGTILYNNTAGDGTLSGAEVNLLPSTSFTSSATINVAAAATAGALANSAQFDGTTTPIDCFLNVAVPTASDIDANATVTASGIILLTWVNLGDY